MIKGEVVCLSFLTKDKIDACSPIPQEARSSKGSATWFSFLRSYSKMSNGDIDLFLVLDLFSDRQAECKVEENTQQNLYPIKIFPSDVLLGQTLV